MEPEIDRQMVVLKDLVESERYGEGFLSFIKEIYEELKYTKEVDVPLNFIINMIKLVSIDPTNKFLIKQQLVPSEVTRLKRIVTEKIFGMSEISRAVIRLQYQYREKLIPREKVFSTHTDQIDAKIVPLMAELKKSVPKHIRHFDMYYSKLIAATIHYAEMGPLSEQCVIDETRAALERVFHIDDINLLSSMTPKVRGNEIVEIIQISIGLRILRKEQSHPGTYGRFIEDLPKNLPRKLHSGLKHLRSLRSLSTGRLVKYTAAIQKYFLKHYLIRAGRREVNISMVKARQGLTMVHQVLLYIRELMEEMENEEKYVEHIIDKYKALVKDLHKEKRKNSIPNSTLYPKYIELCESWKDLVNSNIYVNLLLELSTDIIQLTEKELIDMDDFVNEFMQIQNLKEPSEQDFFNFSKDPAELDNTANALVKRFDYSPDLDPLKMNFSGFCVNSLVKGVGMLVYGNPNLGVFTWKNMSFILANPEAVSEFCKNPGVVIKRAIGIARRWPELIPLLNIETEAYDPSGVNDLDGYRKFFSGVLVTKSSEMQSETHPIPQNIVESYTWNEWELRRRGIILSKIHKCRTHSTQTYWQSLRKSVPSQTYAKQSREVQTNRNVHTQVPKTQFYFAGLRGYHCGMSPHVVEMTTENLEDLYCLCKPAPKKENELVETDANKRKKKSIGLRF